MDKKELIERLRVLQVARTYLGTPFHDQQRVKGAGIDCAYLIASVFEEAGLIEHIDIGYYSPQFFLHHSEEKYLSFVLPRAVEIEQEEAKAADLVVFKVGRCFAHGALILEEGWPSILHAYKPEGIVTIGRGDVGELGERERRFFRYSGWGCGKLVRG